jgi:hypothetical protein
MVPDGYSLEIKFYSPDVAKMRNEIIFCGYEKSKRAMSQKFVNLQLQMKGYFAYCKAYLCICFTL